MCNFYRFEKKNILVKLFNVTCTNVQLVLMAFFSFRFNRTSFSWHILNQQSLKCFQNVKSFKTKEKTTGINSTDSIEINWVNINTEMSVKTEKAVMFELG